MRAAAMLPFMFRLMVLLLAWVAQPAAAGAIEVTDLAGRTVAVASPVERYVISEGRYLPLIALLRPDDPLAGLVGMMNPLGWTQPGLEAQLFERYPEARDLPLFALGGADSVSVEQIIELRPELAILGLSDHGPGAESFELIRQLEESGTAIVFIDFRLDPLNNTIPSIELLGRLLGAEERAAEYVDFYRQRLDRIAERATEVATRPKVFLQAHPGRFECCWGMADGMLGPVVGFVGGANISNAVAPGPTAQHTAEFLLVEDPDVWIGTASGTLEEFLAGGTPVTLGDDVPPEMAEASLARYLAAPEFRHMSAVTNGRAHAIWHNFYNSPFNIVAFEAFATWIQPELFADLEPHATLQEIYDRFLPFEREGTYMATLERLPD